MNPASSQALPADALRAVFLKQLSILYNAKINLVNRLPQLISQATFNNLKMALQEDSADTDRQMVALKQIFTMMGESWLTDCCLGMNAVMDEAHLQVVFNTGDHFESDMSIVFYMSVIENLQVG